MKSPITGSEMKEKTEYTTIKIKGRKVRYINHFYECPDTKERFTTTELDELNL
jgi:hypothetical protein